VLGVPLYDKLTTDFENNIPFTGVYDTIFYKYVAHLHSHYTASYYYSLGLVKSSQNGAYYVTPEKTERISEEKAHKLASDYKGIAMGLETELIAYLETLSIPEWVVKTKAKKPLNWIKL
jgi:hypothetical protein